MFLYKKKIYCLFSDSEEVENANNSIDDGGPLEVSALSMKDDDDDHNDDDKEKEETDDDDDDDEMPPKITMEDLADDLDSTEENIRDQGADSPEMKFEELTRRESLAPEKAVTEVSDSKRKEGMPNEHLKSPRDSMKVEDIGSNVSEEPRKSNDNENGHSKFREYDHSAHHSSSSQRNWQTRDYSATESYHKYWYSHFNELDEDVILMRARAALRRANRFSPPKGKSTYSFNPDSLSMSDLSLNMTSSWEPVRMSTPLVPRAATSTNYRSHVDHDSRYGYKSTSRSHRHDVADVVYAEESGLGRSGGEMSSSHHHHGVSGRRLSPAVEDIIRRRKLQENLEGKIEIITTLQGM